MLVPVRVMEIHGRVLMSLGRATDAEPVFAELYQRAVSAEIAPELAAAFAASYGLCLVSLSRFQDAEQPLREAQRRLREMNQTKHPRMQQVLEALARVCEKTNRSDEAATYRAEMAIRQAGTRPASP